MRITTSPLTYFNFQQPAGMKPHAKIYQRSLDSFIGTSPRVQFGTTKVTGEENPVRLLNSEPDFNLDDIELSDAEGSRIWFEDTTQVNLGKQIAFAMCDKVEGVIVKVMELNTGEPIYLGSAQEAWAAERFDDLDAFFPDEYWDNKIMLNYLNRWVVAPSARGVDVVRLHLIPEDTSNPFWQQLNHAYEPINRPLGEDIRELPQTAFETACRDVGFNFLEPPERINFDYFGNVGLMVTRFDDEGKVIRAFYREAEIAQHPEAQKMKDIAIHLYGQRENFTQVPEKAMPQSLLKAMKAYQPTGGWPDHIQRQLPEQ